MGIFDSVSKVFAGGGGSILAGTAASAADMLYGNYQADKQRSWQEGMSNTAHTREVRDLERAGLNPILSAKYGGSSTPTGAMAPPSNFASSVQGMAALAQQRHLMNEQIENIKADTAKKESEKAYTDFLTTGKGPADVKNIESLSDLNSQQLDHVKAQINKLVSDIDLNKAHTSHQNMENEVKRIATDFLVANGYLVKTDAVGGNRLLSEVMDLIGAGAIGRGLGKFFPKDIPKPSSTNTRYRPRYKRYKSVQDSDVLDSRPSGY